MRKELKKISYKHKGKTVLNLWNMLFELQNIYKVDFWDYYNSDRDFDNWADSKGYGKIDSNGDKRRSSNIWFKEWQADINKGVWKKLPYCSFIDMFMDDIQDLGNDESKEVYEVDLKSMMKRAIEEDHKDFGKDDYRVHLTGILISELGDNVLVDQYPE